MSATIGNDTTITLQNTRQFNAITSNVDLSGRRIRVGLNHGFITGDALAYNSNGTQAVGGLSSGSTYYAIASEEDDTATDYDDREWIQPSPARSTVRPIPSASPG